MDTSSSFDDRLPSYDEVDYKCYTGDDVSTVDTKTSLAEPKRERKTLEDVLDIGEWFYVRTIALSE